MPSSNLTISGLCKRYGDVTALAPTDLEVANGEFLTLLGPSGSGKTTLLSLIAGLSQPDSGTMLINGVDVTYGAPYERDIGMVFQNYALFPHMTVEDNIAFPLKMRGVKPAEARQQAQEALEMVRLPHVAQRFPKELSGGQQQRIALARCMVYRPAIILMDEPLGALDKKLRDHMQMEIKRIHRELGTTIVYVTHDQEEAMTMSDRICLMNGGQIEQLGTPADLYFRPRTLFVADFLGESNLFEATVTGAEGDGVRVTLDGGRVQAGAAVHGTVPAPGRKVQVLVRPQNLGVQHAVPDAPGAPALSAQVLDVMITGSLTKLYLQAPFAGETPITVAFPTSRQSTRYSVGETLSLHWQAADAVAISE
ncbi:ABC transporter ATP-binding protein [Variovorax sp. ZT4R33]|uniref:ABC transporter ATP-binding protein n=1 Tax=Variovorax sp. ZT4R33 TaxID=3443743 RepID=UPI003F47E28A